MPCRCVDFPCNCTPRDCLLQLLPPTVGPASSTLELALDPFHHSEVQSWLSPRRSFMEGQGIARTNTVGSSSSLFPASASTHASPSAVCPVPTSEKTASRK